MKIAAITCTNRRQAAMRNCVDYMDRQTRQHDLWVVAGSCGPLDGQVEATICDDGSVFKMVRNEGKPGWANFLCNMRCALRQIPDTYAIAFFEDDDWYRPDHLEHIEAGLRVSEAVGIDGMRYYHTGARAWLNHMGVRTLAGTAFRGKAARLAMEKAIDTAQDLSTYAVDRFFWRLVKLQGISNHTIHERTLVGIKGMEDGSSPNLGIGRDPAGWTPDPDGARLREWIGEDADRYFRQQPATR